VVAAESKCREVGYPQIMKLMRDGISTTTGDGDTYVETHRIRRAPEAPAPRPPSLPEARPPLITAPGPIVIESEDTAAPVSWEEISTTDFVESNTSDFIRPPLPSLVEETQTQQRIDVRFLIEDPRTDEPSTKPSFERPAPRGDLEAVDYARIAVAVERGDAARALFRYGLTMEDLPRLERAWTERATVDPAFGYALAEAVQAARRAP
jgi:hypothetical protein